jgi:hypothetical protein
MSGNVVNEMVSGTVNGIWSIMASLVFEKIMRG